jgi:hypothetical protein
MRIIATTQEENDVVDNLAKDLKEKGVCVNTTHYEDGFGFTVWSIDDLDSVDGTKDWSRDKRIEFMESVDYKIRGAKGEHWEMLQEHVNDWC